MIKFNIDSLNLYNRDSHTKETASELYLCNFFSIGSYSELLPIDKIVDEIKKLLKYFYNIKKISIDYGICKNCNELVKKIHNDINIETISVNLLNNAYNINDNIKKYHISYYIKNDKQIIEKFENSKIEEFWNDTNSNEYLNSVKTFNNVNTIKYIINSTDNVKNLYYAKELTIKKHPNISIMNNNLSHILKNNNLEKIILENLFHHLIYIIGMISYNKNNNIIEIIQEPIYFFSDELKNILNYINTNILIINNKIIINRTLSKFYIFHKFDIRFIYYI